LIINIGLIVSCWFISLHPELDFCLFVSCGHVLYSCVCLLWSFAPVWHFAICLPCLFTKHSDYLSGRLLEWPQYMCLYCSRSEFELFKVEVTSSTLVNLGALRRVSRWSRQCNHLSRNNLVRRHMVIFLCFYWSSQKHEVLSAEWTGSTNSKCLVCVQTSQIVV
jgi:hypothetical protein